MKNAIVTLQRFNRGVDLLIKQASILSCMSMALSGSTLLGVRQLIVDVIGLVVPKKIWAVLEKIVWLVLSPLWVFGWILVSISSLSLEEIDKKDDAQ